MKKALIIVIVIVGVLRLAADVFHEDSDSQYHPPKDLPNQMIQDFSELPQQDLRGIHSPIYPSQTFRGYACTQDCSGHRAGYEWAKEKNISRPTDCTGKSPSFIEGCLSSL